MICPECKGSKMKMKERAGIFRDNTPCGVCNGLGTIELKKGCFSCWNMQYEPSDYEYPADGNYLYCDKRTDEPEENMKTWPAKRKLKCFEPLPENYEIQKWRLE